MLSIIIFRESELSLLVLSSCAKFAVIHKKNVKTEKATLQLNVDNSVNNLYMIKLDKEAYSIILIPKLNKFAKSKLYAYELIRFISFFNFG